MEIFFCKVCSSFSDSEETTTQSNSEETTNHPVKEAGYDYLDDGEILHNLLNDVVEQGNGVLGE